MDIIADQRKNKDFRKFWKSTSKLNVRPSLPETVAGCADPTEIANLFKDHFSVASPLRPSSERADDESNCEGEVLSFHAKQVREIINKMTRGKSPGHDGLSIEHLKFAGVHLPRVLAMFYSLCLSHSYIPSGMMRTVVVPIPKNKTGDMSDKANYRPVSLATIIAKVLDSLLHSQLEQLLDLHDGQFGFRRGLSTESAIMCLKQTVQYYTERRTPVYACFLDLSKAFDTVSYDILWEKLEREGVPLGIRRVLKFWYSKQINYVRWGNALSREYKLECGVRQGGLTSPILFSLYVNDLITELSRKHVGCWIDKVCVNNISYADDMVLLGPTVRSIRELVKTCEEYAASHGLTYNNKKSEYIIFKAKGIPAKEYQEEIKILLNGAPLKGVNQFKYLGHVVTNGLKDDVDIERERRALAVRCNMLVHRFAHCSEEAKVTLFKAFCQNFYTASLWTSYTQASLNALRVQYNNGFRMLLGLPRYCSASDMFAKAHTDDFFAIRRKRSLSLIERARASTNSILRTLAERYDSPSYGLFMKLHIHGSRKSGQYLL